MSKRIDLSEARVLLTGAGGGIGRALAASLLGRGAQIILVGRNQARLSAVARELDPGGQRASVVAADITRAPDRARICVAASRWNEGVNVLINNAGVNQLCLFEEESAADIEVALSTNILAPMYLSNALLSSLQRQPAASILNIGSVLGAIGHPGHVTYSTTKFALRGFSEALRRELAGTTVKVSYLAPRATRTSMNAASVERMNAELGVAMDAPEVVAEVACSLIEQGGATATIGWPESFFSRVNALLPRLVDNAFRRQLPIIERHARGPQAARGI